MTVGGVEIVGEQRSDADPVLRRVDALEGLRARAQACDAPAARCVGRAYRFDVGDRTDDSADLDLHVGLDGRLRSASVFLSPDERHVGAGLRVLGVQDREGQHLALVRAVADQVETPTVPSSTVTGRTGASSTPPTASP